MHTYLHVLYYIFMYISNYPVYTLKCQVKFKFLRCTSHYIIIYLIISTTSLAGGLLCGYKPVIPASSKELWRVRQPHYCHRLPLKVFFYALFTGSSVNGSMYSFNDIWSYSKSSCNWFRTYSSIFFAFLPTVSTKYPLHQKCRFPYLYFKFAAFQISLTNFFLLNIPLFLTRYTLVVYSQTYVHDLAYTLLQLFQFLFFYIIRLVYVLHPVLSACR